MSGAFRCKVFFCVLVFLIVLFSIGIPYYGNFGQSATEISWRGSQLSLNEGGTVVYPYDVSRFVNSYISCSNSASAAKKVQLFVATKSETVGFVLNVKKKATAKKTIKTMLDQIGVTAKQGGIIIEKDAAVSCFIGGLSSVGNAPSSLGLIEIKEDDILDGASYIQDIPTFIEPNTEKIILNELLIYNISLDDTEFMVRSYFDNGKLEREEHHSLSSFGFVRIKAKNNKPRTYHIIPISDKSNYYAINREKISGTYYISRPLRTFKETSFTPKGILSIANVKSEPAMFLYVVTENGKKIYQGSEFVLPYAQRKLDLSTLETLSPLEMTIFSGRYKSSGECSKESECHADESGMIVVSYLGDRNKSQDVVKEKTVDTQYAKSEELPALPIACNIDTTASSYCGNDINSNGVDDAVDYFHYGIDPDMERVRKSTKITDVVAPSISPDEGCSNDCPYSCPGAEGSVNNCCKYGCIKTQLGSMCQCAPDEHPAFSYERAEGCYGSPFPLCHSGRELERNPDGTDSQSRLIAKSVTCCKNTQKYNRETGECETCPDGRVIDPRAESGNPAYEGECSCGLKEVDGRELRVSYCNWYNRNCCGEGTVCNLFEYDEKGQCKKCPGEVVYKDVNDVAVATCMCDDGRTACEGENSYKCCDKDESCNAETHECEKINCFDGYSACGNGFDNACCGANQACSPGVVDNDDIDSWERGQLLCVNVSDYENDYTKGKSCFDAPNECYLDFKMYFDPKENDCIGTRLCTWKDSFRFQFHEENARLFKFGLTRPEQFGYCNTQYNKNFGTFYCCTPSKEQFYRCTRFQRG